MNHLPIDSLIPEMLSNLKSSSSVIVEAPPGSGKTTRVAPALVHAGLCTPDQRAFLLQPRRVAARATAQRIAAEQNWKLGKQVGYHVRFDRRTSDETSLVVATEGMLLRQLSSDPFVENIGTVILDEFHERSLNADLLLGMLRRVQQLVRDDLRIIVMSATLDTGPLQKFLQVPTLNATGTLHPVETKYRSPKPRQKLADHVSETVLLTIEKTDGDVLVFLPGVGEINQTQRNLKSTGLRDCDVLPLHGSLPLEEQNKVLNASERRRIILSTNVAETSLTIEGIRCVIDSGQVRVLRFDPGVGLDRLQMEPICQSSATQRAGRAGRLAAGTCIRLWTEKSHQARPQHLEPEIRRVDLSAAVLQLYQWGEKPNEFPWFEPPRADGLAAAVQLLEMLGAVQEDILTEIGSRMAKLPVTPRLARMLIESVEHGDANIISLLAAMLSERDPFLRERADYHGRPRTKRKTQWDCDVTQRLLALQAFFDRGTQDTPFGFVHRGAAQNIRRVAEQFEKSLDTASSKAPAEGSIDSKCIGKALLVAFPDRLARRRKPGDSKGRMVGGRGVRLAPNSGVSQSELFLCIDVDGRATDATVRQASRVDLEWLPSELIDEREEQFFNPTRKQVEARRRRYWRDLMLSEQTAPITDEEQCHALLINEALKDMSQVLPAEGSEFHSYLTRAKCLREWAPQLELPVCDDDLLVEVLKELCPNRRSTAELKRAPWLDWLQARFTPEQQLAIERECPERIEVPSGNRIRLEYVVGKPPVLAVRIQEVFSWTETPRIAFGRVKILLHLLAPNFRPQQVTDDLSSFWANTYEVIRKELRRRYPKHAWPEDPLTAKPESKGGRRK